MVGDDAQVGDVPRERDDRLHLRIGHRHDVPGEAGLGQGGHEAGGEPVEGLAGHEATHAAPAGAVGAGELGAGRGRVGERQPPDHPHRLREGLGVRGEPVVLLGGVDRLDEHGGVYPCRGHQRGEVGGFEVGGQLGVRRVAPRLFLQGGPPEVVVRVDDAHEPLQRGARRATNAATPSRKSALP
ncbi:hypothetical protein BJF90_18920 [Pseudonocardia sp. CNS-004]|nr:hypothetical protein BJF90_18920 [Pseudonocardia sp. CNS-004]